MANLKNIFLILTIVSFILFLSWVFFVSPYILRFSESELRDWINTGKQKLYDTNTGNYSDYTQSIIVRDRIVSSDNYNFEISSNSLGADLTGKIVYWNASTVYIFNKYSRKNVPGNGIERTGYFAFPRNTQKKDYSFNSPEVLEKEGIVKFNGEIEYRGYKVYNFSFILEDLDKTAYFPLIPKNNKIIGDHKGNMLVEPKTGVILYFQHSGINKIYDSSGKYLLDYEIWSNSFNEFTANKQLQLADNLYNLSSFSLSGFWFFLILWILSIVLYIIFLLRSKDIL